MAIDSSDTEGAESPIVVKARTVAPPIPKPRAARKVKTETKIPALVIARETPTAKKGVKTESSDTFTPDTSNDVKGLPALVGPTWDSHFLPAVYRALYESPEPMTFVSQGETKESKAVAVKAVQAIVDQVYPGNKLTVAWGDKICSRVRPVTSYLYLR